MEIEYHSFRLLAKFPNITDRAEKEEVTCPGPHAWSVRAETSAPFRWPPGSQPFHPPHCPQGCGRLRLTSIACL